MGELLGISAAVGLAVYLWLIDSSDWWIGGTWFVSAMSGHRWVMVSVLLTALGYHFYGRALKFEARRDRAERQAEMLLQQLSQLLDIRGSLSVALDELGLTLEHGSDSSGAFIKSADQLGIEALSMVAEVSPMVTRHGGSMQLVISQALNKIIRDRDRRFQRKLEELGKRSTILILAGAPYGVLLILASMVPTFYRVLVTGQTGHWTILGVGLLSSGVLSVLAFYTWKGSVNR